ncbi:MAG: hypothetical protein WCF40_04995 [Desulfobacterales bacterium]
MPVEKQNNLVRFSVDCLKLHCHNYCELGTMFRCSAGSAWEEQKYCKFSRKSSGGGRCMHFRRNIGGHCDCVPAQKDAVVAMRRQDP